MAGRVDETRVRPFSTPRSPLAHIARMLEDIVTKTNAITAISPTPAITATPVTTTTTTAVTTVTSETDYPFDYEEMQRLARQGIEDLSREEPSRDANGNVIVDSFEVVRRLFLSIMQRMLEIPPPPPGPLQLPPGENESYVRRKIARLRMLKTEVDDPVDGPRILAETLERRAEIRRIVLGIGFDAITALGMMLGIVFRALGRAMLARFRAGKPVYGPADANDTEGELIRKLLRARRTFLGRPQTSGPKRRKWPRRR